MKKLLTLLLVATVLLNACHRDKMPANDLYSSFYSKDNLPTTGYLIDAGKDTVLIGKSGTKLFIGGNTFTDQNGNLITGEVKVELREAISNSDIVFGNMTTTSNGKILQSGGMVYLNAHSGNQQVLIGTGKSIGISVPAERKVSDMKIFSANFDSSEMKLNWVNPEDKMAEINFSTSIKDESDLNSDSILPLKPSSTDHELEKAEKYISQLVAPKKPEVIKPDSDTTITLDFDPAQFPELAQYKNVKFRLRNSPNYDPKEAGQTWTNVDLKKTNEEGIYIITFSSILSELTGSKKEVSYRVSPGFTGEDYKKALSVYNKKFEQYEYAKASIAEQKAKKERKDKIAFEENQRRIQVQNEALERKRMADSTAQANSFRKNASNNLLASLQITSNVNRNYFLQNAVNSYIYEVTGTGWSNIDKYFQDTRMKEVNITANIIDKTEYDLVYVSLLLKNQKVYMRWQQAKDNNSLFGLRDGQVQKLPIGEEATIIATGFKNETPFISIQNIIIKENQNLDLKLEKTSLSDMKVIIDRNI